ncbi:MAG: hypothetical protein RMJ35_05410 [Phycisphaerales bacterium]|nr:hypothetical protein [Phycisphaerales bacterium]
MSRTAWSAVDLKDPLPAVQAADPGSEVLPAAETPSRLISLDIFRGVVILSMLIVNNLGDYASTGYFWKHAGFIPAVEGYRSVQWGAFAQWWSQVRTADAPITTAFTQLPLWKHCTLADYVMPGFILIIGLAIPYSAAAARARGQGWVLIWLRVVRRAALLVLLGWILCYFRDQFAAWWRSDGSVPFRVVCGMDVLQLLGVSYLVSRILYELPARPRLAAAAGLMLWHWGVLRFWPQGDVPRGTFTAANNAISWIYSQPWWIWQSWEPFSWLSINWKGLMSVPPTAGLMLLGTLMGDWLRRDQISPRRRVGLLALAGAGCALIGFLWAFDLPFNKDRWTPCYLLWCAGVGAILLSVIYVIVDVHGVRAWGYPLVVFGSNALAAYFVTVLAKVLLLNTPRIDQSREISLALVRYGTLVFLTLICAWAGWLLVRAAHRQIGAAAYGLWLIIVGPLVILYYRMHADPIAPASQPTLVPLIHSILSGLQQALGQWEGGWVFTIAFGLFWWLVLDAAWRHRIFWKI